MKKGLTLLFILFVLTISFISCTSSESVMIGKDYPPTNKVDLYLDNKDIPKEYIKIGYVEAKGGALASKQDLIDEMVEEAKSHGADALIDILFYDEVHYSPTLGTIDKPRAKALMIKYQTKK